MAEVQQGPQAIHIDRWFTGLYTHRSPLFTPFSFVGLSVIQRKDALLNGLNAELTDLFTIRRRYGFSSFCPISGGALRYIYSWKDLNGDIKLIADETNQATNFFAGGPDNVLFAESANPPSRLTVQAVANTCYFANGIDAKKWVEGLDWQANEAHAVGDVIDASPIGQLYQVTVAGTSGATKPLAFSSVQALGALVVDGSVTWICRGRQIQNFGVVAPKNPPTIAFGPFPSQYPSWAASTEYNATLVIDDVNNNIQQLTTSGTTGTSAPTWNVAVGGTTTDGTAVWTNKGTANWQASQPYSVGNLVVASFSYTYTVIVNNGTYPTYQPTTQTITVTVTNAFKCTVAGTSGASTPNWVPGEGSSVLDNGATWQNIGAPPSWTANQKVSNAGTIVDANGNLQNLVTAGISGTSTPTWGTNPGDLTTDVSVVWSNGGAYSAGGTAAEFYSYAFKASATGHVSSRSPRSAAIKNVANKMNIVQGQGCTDQFYDTIEVYRTLQGGAVDYLLAEIPNTYTNLWTYNDTTPDTQLNTAIQAAIGTNEAPPTGLTNLCFYAGRMWGSVGNTVYFATGPDTTVGVPEESWNLLNYFTFPGQVRALYPIQGGLLVFLDDDLYEILGSTSGTFFAQLSQAKLGIANPDAVAFDGTSLYIYTSLSQLQLVASNGNSEVGFDVADVLKQYFPPASTSLTVLRDGINESALYVSSGTGYMLRYSLTTQSWSPLWQVTGGMTKAWAVEVSPQSYLLLGGNGANIVKRDTSLYTDMGSSYVWNFILGTLALAGPGQWTEVDAITIQSRAGGSVPTVAYLPNDIAGTFATLSNPANEPPLLPQGTTLTGYRWYLETNTVAAPAVMQRIQVQVSFPAENFSNEIFELAILPKGTGPA